jgi:hypothetical protein
MPLPVVAIGAAVVIGAIALLSLKARFSARADLKEQTFELSTDTDAVLNGR